MVTLHILQLLQNNGLGTIDQDLFWEKLPLGGKGVAIYSRGGPVTYGRRSAGQNFDLYSRGASDLHGADKLEKIWEFFADVYTACDLPLTAKSTKLYTNARIVPTGNVENLGADENDRIIFRLSAQVIYQKN